MRLGQQDGRTRIVLDMEAHPQVTTSLSENRQILTINLGGGDIETPLPQDKYLFKSIQTRRSGEVQLRAESPIKIIKNFHLPPDPKTPHHRYVLDVMIDKNPLPLKSMTKPKPVAKKTKVIVIDAGHGGRDPGAMGTRGTKEKDVTLRAALALAKEIQRNTPHKAVLTRTDDMYLSLPERVKIGRKHKGDLFISLHADSSPNKQTRGLSIYTLSKVASDKEAARLAAHENKADMFAGINIGDEPPEVASILIDLTKRETMNLSITFAQMIKNKLQKYLKLLDNTHRFANFAVLRTPDIPAVLVELGYLSNTDDEKLLNTDSYISSVATKVCETINAFFSEQALVAG